MAKVYINSVVVLNNPTDFLSPFQFEIIFQCIGGLKEDLVWKMTYVGAVGSFDQVLDTINVGPVPEGRHKFIFQADPPDVSRIPDEDAVGLNMIILTCSYRDQEFVRVGYLINSNYNEQKLRDNPPKKPQFEKLTRKVFESKQRITRFKINWDDTSNRIVDGEIME